MQVRFTLLAVLLAAGYGCVSEPQQQSAARAAPASAAAAAPEEKPQARDYRTGSRLPSLEPVSGSGYVGGQSKQDYMDDANSRSAPMRSN